MKWLLVAISLWFPAVALADCAAGALTAWPEVLPANGVVVLDGYGDEQPRVAGLGPAGRQAAWLVGGGERVPLTSEAIHVGQFLETQAILRPARPLKPGQTYRLDLGPGAPPVRLLTVPEKAQWVAGPEDTEGPRWTGPAVVKEHAYHALGCGPSINVVVAAPLEGATAVEVKLAGAEGTTTWWVPVVDGTVSIGHGMCSGPFRVQGPGQFEATLVAVDHAGHRAPLADPLRFAGVEPGEK